MNDNEKEPLKNKNDKKVDKKEHLENKNDKKVDKKEHLENKNDKKVDKKELLENKNDKKVDKKEPLKNKNKYLNSKYLTLIVWGVVFFTLAGVFLYDLSTGISENKFDQTQFLNELNKGSIISIKITPINSILFQVDGVYKKNVVSKNNISCDFEDATFSAQILSSEEIINKISNSKANIKPFNNDTWLKSFLFSVLPFIIIIGIIYLIFSRQIKQAGHGAMGFGKSRARMIMPNEHNTKFKDIAGAEEAKEEIIEIVEYLKDPIRFKLLGAKIPKGALLTGPPGTGKTLLAKAVAGEACVPFYSISGSDFVEMFVGVGASRVRDMFEEARKQSPCLIFIYEIDAGGRSRFSGTGGGHDEREQTLNAMLVEMDGLETVEGGVIILAATNRPDVLDKALLRPGRFDSQIVLDLPDIKGRKQILRVHIKNIKTDDTVNLEAIARSTPGFSGADLASLINEAALFAARQDKKSAGQVDFEEARDKVKWGRERKSRRITDHEKKLTAYHEAGHTIIALNCKHSDPIHKVTIIPRGNAYLGATMQLPTEDKYTQSRNELIDDLTVYMGGNVAENLIMGDVTSGASGDIEQATRIARAMVCELGMSDKIGMIHYGQSRLSQYATQEKSYSEGLALELDLEIKRILDDAKKRAEKILIEKRNDLELLAETLLIRETLSGSEVNELLNIYTEKDREFI